MRKIAELKGFKVIMSSGVKRRRTHVFVYLCCSRTKAIQKCGSLNDEPCPFWLHYRMDTNASDKRFSLQKYNMAHNHALELLPPDDAEAEGEASQAAFVLIL